ncbi:TetR/AcrR family transcriptional regulator C-terminal domain-containing protein [Streptosporangium roseum]|uniref:TetR/AcrR family transcriptional regulator C-terminal domain-containing protein n=1 Tax=Streptosporangium roseum TaxID=2001 RepID=UPI003D9E2B89
MAGRDLLKIDDADVAANHCTLLTFTNVADRSYFGAIPIAGEEIRQIAADGVRTFLRLYGTGR